jgi:hypothetical protein
MSGARGVLPIGLILVGISAANLAWARAIVVERPDATDQVLVESFSRLCGELGMYGLEVRVRDRGDDIASPAAATARGERPVDVAAGIRFTRSSGQVSAEIRIGAGHGTGELVSIMISGDANAPTLLAIRTADLLRANLRDIDRPAADVVAGPGEAPRPAPLVRPWIIFAGGSALFEKKLGLGLAPTLRVGRQLTARLAMTMDLVGPIGGQIYRSTDATARIGAAMGTLALAFRAFDRRAASLELFQGLGAARLSVHGEAQAPWSGEDASAWVAAAASGARLGFRVTESVRLSVSVAAVFFLPRPVIDVGNVGYSAGGPFVLSSAGLSVDL